MRRPPGTTQANASSVARRIHDPRARNGFRYPTWNAAKTQAASSATKKDIACQVETARPSGRLASRIDAGVRTRTARASSQRWSANQGTLKSSLIRIQPTVR